MTQQIHFLTRNPFKIVTAELAMKPYDMEYSFQLLTKITDSIRPGGKDFGWDSIISLGDDPRALSEYPQEDQ